MTRFVQDPLWTLALSTSLALACAVAILGFGAPLWILAAAAWGGALLYGAVASAVRGRLGRD